MIGTRGREIDRGEFSSRVARHAVGHEAPRRGVALRREEIAPVLPDQPRAEQGGTLGAAGQVPELSPPADEENPEHGESQRELVDPEAEHVDARTELVALQLQHAPKVAGKF